MERILQLCRLTVVGSGAGTFCWASRLSRIATRSRIGVVLSDLSFLNALSSACCRTRKVWRYLRAVQSLIEDGLNRVGCWNTQLEHSKSIQAQRVCAQISDHRKVWRRKVWRHRPVPLSEQQPMGHQSAGLHKLYISRSNNVS